LELLIEALVLEKVSSAEERGAVARMKRMRGGKMKEREFYKWGRRGEVCERNDCTVWEAEIIIDEERTIRRHTLLSFVGLPLGAESFPPDLLVSLAFFFFCTEHLFH
jgi:hypothetical protein